MVKHWSLQFDGNAKKKSGVEVEVDKLLFVREYIGKNHQYAAEDSDEHIVNIIFACSVPEDYKATTGSSPDADQVAVTWLAIEELDQRGYSLYAT